MNANIHYTIKNEYDRRRAVAEEELREKKLSIYSVIPRLEEIEDEIHRAGLDYSKMLLAGELTTDTATKELSDKINSLKEERTCLLLKNKLDENYLEPSYRCNKCMDTGIITSSDGTADTVCTCYKQQLINHIYKQSNIAFIGKEGFNNFNPDYYSDTQDFKAYGIKNSPRRQILGIYENCKAFIENFKNSKTKNMLFSGPTGVGKTFMAGCIAAELMKTGHTVLYQTAPALFNSIYEYRYKSSRNEESDSALYRSILETELLIIDDLGTESPSAMRYAELLNIIDTRHANDKRKPCKTIIATNIDLKQLFDYYDERIVSRITGGFDIYRFAGDDIRRLKKEGSSQHQ